MKTYATESNSASSKQIRVMPTASGHTMLLSAEDFPIYHLHITRFLTEFQPQNEWESDLVQRIADNEWRINRIARLEMGLYARGNLEFANLYADEDPNVRGLLIEMHTHTVYSRQLSNLSVQEARLRRYVEKDRAELKIMQTERLEREGEKKTMTASAAASSSEGSRGSEASPKNQNGFEFSNSVSAAPRPVAEAPVYINNAYPNGKTTRH